MCSETETILFFRESYQSLFFSAAFFGLPFIFRIAVARLWLVGLSAQLSHIRPELDLRDPSVLTFRQQTLT